MASLARVTRLLSWLLAGLPAAFTCAASDAPAVDPSLFDYDRAAAFDLEIVSTETHQGATVRDVTFAGVEASRPLRAFLVSPSSPPDDVAAILYVHWLGNPSTTNRTEFLHEAVALADRGIVSLLVDAMWAEPKWYQNRIPEDDYAHALRQVKELRRALDFLLLQPGVDAKRVAYVGHDFGAMYGVVMGAIDRRPTTYVLMAGTPHFVDWFLFARQPRDLAAYRAQLAPLDPIHFVGQLAPAPVFFQFASDDEYVPAEAAAKFYAAAKPRKQTATYEARHDLQNPAAAADRITWLLRTLAPAPSP